MSFDVAYAHLEKLGLADRVHTFTESTATVELAAEQLGCEPARIAKSMAFLTDEGPILVLAAGDVKVDNRKFRDTFHSKAKMIPGDQVEALVGHAPGGVCPFGAKHRLPRLRRRRERRALDARRTLSRGGRPFARRRDEAPHLRTVDRDSGTSFVRPQKQEHRTESLNSVRCSFATLEKGLFGVELVDEGREFR